MSDPLFAAVTVPAGSGVQQLAGTVQRGSGSEVAFPFQVTPHGRVATATWEAHVEQMIEQVLFTAPGERVNRPDFGCGLQLLVFAGENDALVTATQFLVQGSLQRWLGDLIVVNAVLVQAEDSTFAITVQYTLRESGVARTSVFRRAAVRP